MDLATFSASYPLTAGPIGDADVVHVAGQTMATCIAFAKPRQPTLVTVHDILPWTLRRDPRLSTFRHPADVLFFRLALRGVGRADLILTGSDYTKRELGRVLGIQPERIVVTPYGASPTPARPSTSFGRYVLYVGSEDPRKNVPALVRAFASVASTRPGLRLVRVGRAADRSLVARLGIADRVTFVEHASPGELASLYAGAAAVAVPSLYEGFGLPLVEAMAHGAPVVSSNRTSLPEVAGDAALLVEPDSASLAEGLARVLDDPALSRQLAERGTERAAQFTWQRTAKLTAEAYTRVASEGRHG